MSLPILAIGRDDILFMREQAVWLKRGVDMVRVSTMQDGIEKLNNQAFLFAVINADCIDFIIIGWLASREDSLERLLETDHQFKDDSPDPEAVVMEQAEILELYRALLICRFFETSLAFCSLERLA